MLKSPLTGEVFDGPAVKHDVFFETGDNEGLILKAVEDRHTTEEWQRAIMSVILRRYVSQLEMHALQSVTDSEAFALKMHEQDLHLADLPGDTTPKQMSMTKTDFPLGAQLYTLKCEKGHARLLVVDDATAPGAFQQHCKLCHHETIMKEQAERIRQADKPEGKRLVDIDGRDEEIPPKKNLLILEK